MSGSRAGAAAGPATGVPRVQRGIGLIEILVAVVLMSIGFLAAARMQVQGMRFSQSAYHQSQAHFLAADMIDRMRLNSRGVAAGAYDALDTEKVTTDPGCNAALRCSPAQQASQDAFDWRSYFKRPDGTNDTLLPSAAGAAANGTVTLRPNDTYEVSVTWYEIVDGEERAENLRTFFVPEER